MYTSAGSTVFAMESGNTATCSASSEGYGYSVHVETTSGKDLFYSHLAACPPIGPVQEGQSIGHLAANPKGPAGNGQTAFLFFEVCQLSSTVVFSD